MVIQCIHLSRSGCLAIVLPLDIGGGGRESEADDEQLSLTKIQFSVRNVMLSSTIHLFFPIPILLLKSCGDQVHGKTAGEDALAAVVRKPAHAGDSGLWAVI